MPLQIRVAGHSIKGIRAVNEDAIFFGNCPADSNGLIALIAVADGMGGTVGGNIASAQAVEGLNELLHDSSIRAKDDFLAAIEKHVSETRNRLQLLAEEDSSLTRMGTTFVAVGVFKDGHIIVANLGDSRAYFIRNNKLQQVTYDHTIKGEALRDGQNISENLGGLAENLTRSLSVGHVDDKIDFFTFNIHDQETDQLMVLVCSDGLYKYVTDKIIADYFSRQKNASIELLAVGATDCAVASNSQDNISVCLLEITPVHSANDLGRERLSQQGQKTQNDTLSFLPWFVILSVLLITVVFFVWLVL